MPNKAPRGLAARRAAVGLLSRVISQGVTLEDAFAREASSTTLANADPRDRAFARNLAATALRRRGQITDALGRFVKKPLPAGSGPTPEILQIGAAQILFLETPPHAAIDMAVRSANADRKSRSFKGLVNAVLRRLSENREDILAEQDAETLNTPPWLMVRWQGTYGSDTARAICAMHAHPPSLDITVRAGAADWAERLGAEILPTRGLRLVSSGPVSELPGYGDGAWWVQDAAAALPVVLLGEVSGREVLDLCAAPGGKTMQLAAAGARVTAVDVSATRLQVLAGNLARTGLEANVVCDDARSFAPECAPDLILLDAPCSATGTIRRHPDILYARTRTQIGKLARLQGEMLDHALALLKPGGRLVYCTCSLEPEEGEGQIEAVLARHGSLARLPVEPAEVGGLPELITKAGDLRTLPCHLPHADPRRGGLDGFFAGRLVKR